MTTSNECSRARTLTASKILSKTSKKRIENATEALQKYIEQCSNTVQTNPAGTPISCCYGSSNVSLLPTKPKSFSSPRKATKSTGKQENMADNLVQWVNESYSKDLQRKIVPFGQRSSSSVDTNDLSQTEGNGDMNDEEMSTISYDDVPLSTLPSPGSSIVSELDSNIDSVSTEMLVKSFYEHGNSQQSARGTINHPSWVEDLVTPKHYPSWVDEIDQSAISHQDTQLDARHNQRNRLSRSLSPSFFQEHPPPFPNPSSFLSTSLQEHPIMDIEIRDPHQKKSRAWDLESTDTEVLISESIYGRQPVNMGGAFHNSLYHDKKIKQLHDHSVRKFAKDAEQSLLNEMSFAQSNIEERKTNENLSSTNTQRFTKPRQMSNTKTPIPKHAKKTTEHPKEAFKSFQHDRGPQITAENHLPLQRNNSSKKVMTSTNRPSSLNLQKRNGIISISEIRKNSTDSSNTDRLMRQSPTGIQMAKQDTQPRHIENSSKKDSGTFKQSRSSTVMQSINIRSSSNEGSRISTQIRTPKEMRTPNMPHSSRDFRAPNMPHSTKDVRTQNAKVTPRHSATEELQRIIDFAENNSNEALRQRRDHYLSGKVSKRDLTLHNDRISTSKGNRPKRTGPSSNTSMEEHQENGYPTRIASRNLSPTRLVPSDKYHEQSPPWNENPTSDNHRSKSYEKNTSRTKIPWNSDPTNFTPGTKTRDRKIRSRTRTKSAPDIARRNAHYANARIFRDGEYANHVSYANERRISDTNFGNERRIADSYYANQRRISDANYANAREISRDETESVDTEALIIKPPMPLFDGSPSLTTVSAESDIGSEESGDTLIENLALRTSFLATDTELQSSGTSYLELTTSHQQDPERSQDWKEENPLNARLNFHSKPGIITSFLEDCMRSSQESLSDIRPDNGKIPPPSFIEEEQSVISDDSSERPVETLKKMLFTVQRLTHSIEEDSDRDVNNPSLETQSESLTEDVLSDILSTASRNEGQDSLSRAYYHLARLKRLVSASKEVAAWK